MDAKVLELMVVTLVNMLVQCDPLAAAGGAGNVTACVGRSAGGTSGSRTHSDPRLASANALLDNDPFPKRPVTTLWLSSDAKRSFMRLTLAVMSSVNR